MVPDKKLKEQQELLRLQQCLKVANLKRVLPANCFKKDLQLSIAYGVFDMAVIFCSFYLYRMLLPLNVFLHVPAYILYSAFTGFFMWALFVVGHDCDHGSFSDSRICNIFFGHVFHGAIMTPFFPWQRSHLKHHNHHNHCTKDWSHPSRFRKGDGSHALDDAPVYAKFIFPFIAWLVYLTWGPDDGSHFLPNPYQRIYKQAHIKEYFKCLFSGAVNLAWMYFFVSCLGSFRRFLYFYTGPWIIFGFCLFTVTYMQHHTDDTVVFDDSNWTFERAAMETVDRKWGFPLDLLHHRITDCHVVHHLCHGSIPHYRLREATDALVNYLNEQGLAHFYKFDECQDWFTKIFSMIVYHKAFNDKLKKY